MKATKRLVGAASGSVLTAFAGQGVLLISGVLAARLLGVEDRGILALFALLATAFGQVGTFGLPLAVTYFAARNSLNEKEILRHIFPVASFQSSVSIAIYVVIVLILSADDNASVHIAGLITAITIPSMIVQQYTLAVLQGTHRFAAFNVLRLLPALVYAVALTVVFVLRVGELPEVAAGWTASNAGAAMLTVVVAVRRASHPYGRARLPSLGEMLRFGAKGFLGAASPLVTFRLDQAVVGLFLSPSALGIYVVGAAFTNLPGFVAQSIGMVAYPNVAGQPDRDIARRLMWQFFWIAGAVCLALVMVLEILAGSLVPLFFGREFAEAVPIARILLLSGLLLGVRRVLSDAARGAGYPTLGSVAEVVAWLALLPALGILGPLLGLEGVALGLVVAAAASLGATIILLRLDRKDMPQFSTTAVARRAVRYHMFMAKLRERDVKRKAVSVLIIAMLTVIAGSTVAILSDRLTIEVDVLIALTTIAVAAAPIVRRVATRSLDLLEPIVSGVLTLAILFGVRPLSMMLTESTAIYYGHDIDQYFKTTIVMGLIGTIVFVLGYELTFMKSPTIAVNKPSQESIYQSTASAVVIIMSVLAILLFALHLSISGSIIQTLKLMAAGRSLELVDATAGTSAYLSVAPLLTSCAAIVIIATKSQLNKNDIAKVVVLVAFPVVMFSLIGNRRFIIPSVAIPLAVYYLKHGKRPSRKTVMLVAPVILILLAAIPYARARGAREQAGGALPIIQSSLTSPLDTWKQFITGPDTEMISMLAVEVELLRNPEDFYYGRAVFGDLLLAPIPSAVFPWKPDSARDQMLIDAFGLPCRTVGGGLCPDSSVIGTFYQDLWYFGLIFGMTLLGAWSAWIWVRVKADRGFITVITASCWIVFLPIIIRAGFMPAFSWFLYFLIPSLVGVAASTKIGINQRSSRRRTAIHARKARAI